MKSASPLVTLFVSCSSVVVVGIFCIMICCLCTGLQLMRGAASTDNTYVTVDAVKVALEEAITRQCGNSINLNITVDKTTMLQGTLFAVLNHESQIPTTDSVAFTSSVVSGYADFIYQYDRVSYISHINDIPIESFRCK